MQWGKTVGIIWTGRPANMSDVLMGSSNFGMDVPPAKTMHLKHKTSIISNLD